MKKAVFEHNRNFRVQAMLLEKAAKLMVKSTVLSVTEFTEQILRDVALEQVTAKTFEHMKTSTLLHNLPLSDTIQIYETKMRTASF